MEKFLWQESSSCLSDKDVLKLSEPFLDTFQREIQEDLNIFERAKFVTKKNEMFTGIFKRIVRNSDVDIWVYLHSVHVASSDCSFNNFLDIARFTIPDVSPPKECDFENHNMLKPFFSDNLCLAAHYMKSKLCSQELEELKKILADPSTGIPYNYHTGGKPDLMGVHFSQDDWSKRLCGAIRTVVPEYANDIHYTAQEGPRFAKLQHWNTSMLYGGIACYPFHGASDIIIRHSSVTNDGECLDSIEKQNQDYPPKLGELFSQLHILIVQKVLRLLIVKSKTEEFMKKKEEFSAGLYLNRLIGGIYCKATMPIVEVGQSGDSRMELFIEQSAHEMLTGSRLCYLLEKKLNLPIKH